MGTSRVYFKNHFTDIFWCPKALGGDKMWNMAIYLLNVASQYNALD